MMDFLDTLEGVLSANISRGTAQASRRLDRAYKDIGSALLEATDIIEAAENPHSEADMLVVARDARTVAVLLTDALEKLYDYDIAARRAEIAVLRAKINQQIASSVS